MKNDIKNAKNNKKDESVNSKKKIIGNRPLNNRIDSK